MRFTVSSLRAWMPPLSHRVLVDVRRLRRGCGSIIAGVLLATLFGAASPAQAGTQGASSFLITATSGSGGSISPSGNVAVLGGASITFIIAPEPCNFILDVVVDGASVGAVANYAFNNVTANHTIAVTFGLSTYSITPSAGSGGTISPPSAVILNCAQSQVVNIAPSNCYAIFDVRVDGVSVGPVATYSFDNVNSDHTIDATFALIPYAIATSSGSGGMILPGGTVALTCGGQQTFNIIPDLCHSVVDVLVDGVSAGAVTSYGFNDVRATHTISATFALDTYTISASAGAGGAISPDLNTVVTCGSDQAYTITPNACYRVSDVFVDGVSIGAELAYTLTNVQANRTISATFALNTYPITVSAGAGGSISPSGTVTVTCAQDQSFAITPDPCYSIASVSVDGLPIPPTSLYTFTNVGATHSIGATFSANLTIAASAGPGGSITPGGNIAVICGDSQSFTIATDACHTLASVLVDGVSVGAVTSYSFASVAQSHTIAVSFVSTAVATTTTLSSSPNPSVCLQTVTLQATVSPGSATGSVEFFEGATSLGTAAVAGGVAALAPVAYSVGSHVLTAVFTPTGCFTGSSAASDTQVVNRAASSVAVGADINPSLWAQAVTFTATITPSSATGTVTFRDSIATLGVVPVAGGVAQIVRSNLPVGLHTQITATYNGDACFATSVSAAPAQRVNRAACAVSATTDINPAQFGQKIFLTATTTPSGPTGSIKIYADGNLIGTVILNSGTGTGAMSINNLLPGSHNMTVTYPGDIHFTGAASVSPYVQVITMTPTSVVMTSDVTPAKFGQVITLTATVSPNDAAGTVEFFDGATSLGTAPVGINGVASLTLSTLTVGTHSLTAVFGDGTAYASSTSPPYTQEITPDQPPVVTVIYPNGGESVNLGSTITITWTATDNTAVNAVKIELSRNNGSSWETLASGLTNTGSYDWSSAGAGTNPDTAHVYSALVRVTATDNAGVDGTDTSDAPFSLFDLQTAVILTRLDAETVEDGVSITWGLSNPALFASLALQRSPAEAGPWNDVSAQLSDDAGLTVAIDRSAVAGQSYFYRLVATTGGGTQAVFGPVRGRAGSPKEFSLSPAWPNPSRGPLKLRFTVPRPARVKLSVVDLMGREVAVLVDGEQAAGRYQVDWDGRSAQGTVAAGLYFLRFSTPERQIVSRVTIAR